MFVTVEDETGDVQLIIWPHVFQRNRNSLRSQVLFVRGLVSRWDGAASVVVSEVRTLHPRVSMPAAHDWR